MRNEGSGSSLTRPAVGGQRHIISQQTSYKQEGEKDPASRVSAKLPPGDCRLLFHGLDSLLLLPHSNNNHKARTVYSGKQGH